MENVFGKTKNAKEKQAEESKYSGIEYADYEFFRKSKVAEYLSNGEEFFVLDMEKKRIYSSFDLRLRDISEKLEKDGTAVFRVARYS